MDDIRFDLTKLSVDGTLLGKSILVTCHHDNMHFYSQWQSDDLPVVLKEKADVPLLLWKTKLSHSAILMRCNSLTSCFGI